MAEQQKIDITAVMVCVDYSDFLAITLPYNKRQFEKILVITHPEDEKTLAVCKENGVNILTTTAFYARGAEFAKWRAMEIGIDYVGRSGWMCLMDCDVLIPEDANWGSPQIGKMYCPMRREIDWKRKQWMLECSMWKNYRFEDRRTPPQGHLMLFHASDPVLRQQPWFDSQWRWCGTGDEKFVERWRSYDVLRPRFEILHLGKRWDNWCGRVEPYLDGSEVPEEIRTQRAATVKQYHRQARLDRGLDDAYKGDTGDAKVGTWRHGRSTPG